MKLSFLHNFLNGSISISVFKEHIFSELEAFARKPEEKGISRPVLVDEDISWNFASENLRTLLEYYINGTISVVELEYICDAIEFSDKIQYNPKIADILSLFSNPEINGAISQLRAQEILSKLSS